MGSDDFNEARLAMGSRLKKKEIPFAVIPCTTSQFVLGRGIQAISKANGGFFDTLEEAIEYFEKVAAGNNSIMKDSAFINLGILYAKKNDAKKSLEKLERITFIGDSIFAPIINEELGIKY